MRWGSIFRGRIIRQLFTPLGGNSYEGKESFCLNGWELFLIGSRLPLCCHLAVIRLI